MSEAAVAPQSAQTLNLSRRCIGPSGSSAEGQTGNMISSSVRRLIRSASF